jgi:catechol 2,3-dioxygenase-like lactoylglutathione lyase family enzyme
MSARRRNPVGETAQTEVQKAMSGSTISGLSHISIHVRDIDEAVRFWTTVFGAEPYLFCQQPESGRAHLPVEEYLNTVVLGGVVLHFSPRPGISGLDTEYPHIAFKVTSEQFRELRSRLEQAGVKTHPIWTRFKVEGLMYFRDPSGNLFEFFCWQYDQVDEAQHAAAFGGWFKPPIDELHYDWNDGEHRG